VEKLIVYIGTNMMSIKDLCILTGISKTVLLNNYIYPGIRLGYIKKGHRNHSLTYILTELGLKSYYSLREKQGFLTTDNMKEFYRDKEHLLPSENIIKDPVKMKQFTELLIVIESTIKQNYVKDSIHVYKDSIFVFGKKRSPKSLKERAEYFQSSISSVFSLQTQFTVEPIEFVTWTSKFDDEFKNKLLSGNVSLELSVASKKERSQLYVYKHMNYFIIYIKDRIKYNTIEPIENNGVDLDIYDAFEIKIN
jgi:hypothetical protein